MMFRIERMMNNIMHVAGRAVYMKHKTIIITIEGNKDLGWAMNGLQASDLAYLTQYATVRISCL